MRNAYKMLAGKSEGKRPIRRPRHRWEYNRMDINKIGWKVVDWIFLAQDRDR
jgi:hypothetical protein